MTKKQRERYTERARPHRKSTGVAGGFADEGFKNPMVLVAVAGLVMAVFLVLGFMLGRGSPAPSTAQDTLTEDLAGADDLVAADSGADAEAVDVAESSSGEAESGADADADAGEPATELTQYAAPGDMGLEPGEKSYFATIETDRGTIVLELWPEIAPQHVNAFAFLASEGFYDGLTFHRVEPGFVIQGGDPLGNGTGGPGYNLPAEFNADNPVPHRAGTLAMARSMDENSGGSQFYIVLEDGPSASGLDGQYTVFGHVVEGMDTVRAIQKGDVMRSVTFEAKDISERVVSPDDIREGNLP
ncbi:MAG: peptidylprolyl isomerase [Anaerolineae bacterium]